MWHSGNTPLPQLCDRNAILPTGTAGRAVATWPNEIDVTAAWRCRNTYANSFYTWFDIDLY